MASPTAPSFASPSPSPPAPCGSPLSDAELIAHSLAGSSIAEGYHYSEEGMKGWKTQKKTTQDGTGDEVVYDVDAPVDFDRLASNGDFTVHVQYRPLPNQPSSSPTPVKEKSPIKSKSPEPAVSQGWGSWAASFVPAVVSDSVSAVVAAAVPVTPRYVWKGVGLVAHPPEHLFRLFHDHESQCEWNKALQETRLLRSIPGTRTSVSYVVSAPAAGGAVSSREFLNTHHWNRTERTDAEGHKHVDYSFAGSGLDDDQFDLPPNPSYVRGLNGSAGFLMRSVRPHPASSDAADPSARWCIFILIMDTDVRGWVPKTLTDQAAPDILVEFIQNVRQTCKRRVEQNRPLPPHAPDTY